jgi:hypothetical protein
MQADARGRIHLNALRHDNGIFSAHRARSRLGFHHVLKVSPDQPGLSRRRLRMTGEWQARNF